MFVGLLNPKKLFFIKGADFSYGMYLYGFPIQQVYASLFPDHRIWALNVGFSLVVAAFFAYLSWTYIEAPIMARKKQALIPVNKFAGWLDGRFGAVAGFLSGADRKETLPRAEP
jgi:peptidoglycan/LPS O-acetylase OafA/YrhL